MPSSVKLRLRDFDHGLAKALGVVALFMVDKTQQKVVDVVTGTAVTIGSGVTIVDTPEGPALHFSGSQQFNFDHPAVDGTAGVCDYITVGRIRATAQQGGNPGQIFGPAWKSGDQASYGIGWDNSATPKVGGTVLNGNGAGMSVSVTTALNRFDTVAAIGDSGSFHSTAWVNGVSLGTNQGTGGVGNPNTISFGAQVRLSGTLRHATGDLLWGAILKRVNSAVFDTRPSDAEMWSLYASDFPHSLFRTSRRPWLVASSGSTYNETQSESGSAADTVSNAATLVGTAAESVTALETPSSAGVLGATQAESATATDTDTSSVVFPSTVSESGAASDTPTNFCTFPSSAAEAGTALDTPSSVAVYPSTVAESGTAVDSPSAGATTYNVSISESVSGADALSSSATLLAAGADTVSAADAASNSAALVGTASETLAALESATSAGTFVGAVTETAAANDNSSAEGDLISDPVFTVRIRVPRRSIVCPRRQVSITVPRRIARAL